MQGIVQRIGLQDALGLDTETLGQLDEIHVPGRPFELSRSTFTGSFSQKHSQLVDVCQEAGRAVDGDHLRIGASGLYAQCRRQGEPDRAQAIAIDPVGSSGKVIGGRDPLALVSDSCSQEV